MPKWFTSTHACADTPFNVAGGGQIIRPNVLESPLKVVLIKVDYPLKVVVISVD